MDAGLREMVSFESLFECRRSGLECADGNTFMRNMIRA